MTNTPQRIQKALANTLLNCLPLESKYHHQHWAIFQEWFAREIDQTEQNRLFVKSEYHRLVEVSFGELTKLSQQDLVMPHAKEKA